MARQAGNQTRNLWPWSYLLSLSLYPHGETAPPFFHAMGYNPYPAHSTISYPPGVESKGRQRFFVLKWTILLLFSGHRERPFAWIDFCFWERSSYSATLEQRISALSKREMMALWKAERFSRRQNCLAKCSIEFNQVGQIDWKEEREGQRALNRESPSGGVHFRGENWRKFWASFFLARTCSCGRERAREDACACLFLSAFPPWACCLNSLWTGKFCSFSGCFCCLFDLTARMYKTHGFTRASAI